MNALVVTRRLFRRRAAGLMLLLVAVTAGVTWFDPTFLAIGNVRDILVRCAPTAIVSSGVMLVVVAGEIDISVGSMMALLAAVLGITLSQDHAQWPVPLGISATLALGTLIGCVTGILVAWGRVPSIVVTLGLLTSLRGLSTLAMRGENITGLPRSLELLAKQGILGLPISVWVAAAVVAANYALVSHTPLGRRLYAVGSNSSSAQILGLSERRLKLFAFAYTGFLTALATVVDIPRLPVIEAGIGREFELLVVTCVVVGGVSVAGGRGTVTGVMLAVVLMTMIRPVLTYLDIGESAEKWTKAIQGLFILLAVVSDSLARQIQAKAT